MRLNHVAILYPSGNTTALVFDPVEKSDYREINDFMLATDPSIEVVMFVDMTSRIPSGEMAGGEFCGNATRSFGYYLLKGQDGETTVRVSGASEPLKVNVASGRSKANVPVPKSQDIVEMRNDGTALVKLDGITHLVLTPQSSAAKDMLGVEDFESRRNIAEVLLKENKLTTIPTCGVIAVGENGDGAFMVPYIRSNPLDDWYAETACGSGSLSVALVQAKRTQKAVSSILLKQPSGHRLSVSVDFANGQFSNASIEGAVNLLYEGTFTQAYRPAYKSQCAATIHKFSK